MFMLVIEREDILAKAEVTQYPPSVIGEAGFAEDGGGGPEGETGTAGPGMMN